MQVRYVSFRDHAAAARSAAADDLAAAAAAERVLLETCHRVELVTVGEAEAAPHGAVLRGRDAVRRVFEVVAGFDSAILAEEQVLGQARTAYERALAARSSGPVLNELFRRALRFGRHVRSHARPGGDRSLADRAVAWLCDRLPERGAAVIVVGSGEMGRLVAGALGADGHQVTLVSGSEERGTRVLADLAGDGHRLAVGPLTPELAGGADAVVLATRTREPMLTAEHLPGGVSPWTVDLCVPAGVDAAAASVMGKRLLTIDDLGRDEPASGALDAATEARLRARLDDEVQRFCTWLAGRRGADAVALLHDEAHAVRRRHLERLARRSGLTGEQLTAVEAASAAMLAELLHGPSVELRRGGTDADVVRRLFGLET